MGGGSRDRFRQESFSCGLCPGHRAGVPRHSLHSLPGTAPRTAGGTRRSPGRVPRGSLLVGCFLRPRLSPCLCRSAPRAGIPAAIGPPADVLHCPIPDAESPVPRPLPFSLDPPAGPRGLLRCRAFRAPPVPAAGPGDHFPLHTALRHTGRGDVDRAGDFLPSPRNRSKSSRLSSWMTRRLKRSTRARRSRWKSRRKSRWTSGQRSRWSRSRNRLSQSNGPRLLP